MFGLTQQEIIRLKEVEDILKGNEDIKKIIKKIYNCYEKNMQRSDLEKLNRIMKNRNLGLENIYINIRKAINNKNKVYIEYSSNESKITKRIIHPAEMFYYLEYWYVAAFCENKNAIRLFKLSDIINYEILNEKYEDFEIKK